MAIFSYLKLLVIKTTNSLNDEATLNGLVYRAVTKGHAKVSYSDGWNVREDENFGDYLNEDYVIVVTTGLVANLDTLGSKKDIFFNFLL